MARVLESSGIRTYLVSASPAIRLEPYEYGFIGGASGCDGDTVYFMGDIDSHPDSELIKSAVMGEGLIFKSLPAGGGLFDLGRLIFCE